ncbi:MAG: hypothetical protein ACO1SV_14885 [Fimbriimonas sp.]
MKATLLFVLLALATSFARASFVLAPGYPMGGTVTGAMPLPYASGTNGYGGTMGGSPSTASGEITFRFLWAGTTPAPTRAQLVVYAEAGWSGSGGSCANGLGDPEVYKYPNQWVTTPIGGDSKGKKTIEKPVNFGVVEYKITPTASASGSVRAFVKVDIYDMSLGSPGTIVIGQQFGAQVVGTHPFAPGDTFIWSTPSGGAPFDDYQAHYTSPTNTSAVYYPFTVPSITEDTLYCYFAKPGTVTISCTYNSPTYQVSIPMSLQITVAAPTTLESHEGCGTMQLMKGITQWSSSMGTPTQFELYGASYDGNNAGFLNYKNLLDPPGFPGGNFAFVQLKNRTSTEGFAPNVVTDPQVGLDKSYPLTGWHLANGNFLKYYADSPGFKSFLDFPFTGTWTGTYKNYTMYLPADNLLGPSVPVPIRRVTWYAKGHATSSANGLVWPVLEDDGSGIDPSETIDYPAHPEW